jgi:flagellar hook assembly protein FlgD
MLIVSPNPVKDKLLINYQIEDAGYLSIEVYNQSGRMVKKLVDRNETAGKGSFFWNLLDDTGNRVPHGNYIIRLRFNQSEESLKVLVL